MNLLFREPANINELEALFRLRYTVYSEDVFLNKMISPGSIHDINVFDFKALHFAGFDGKQPVAYMRMVTKDETRFSGWVGSIVSSNNFVVHPGDSSYPFQSYCTDKDWGRKFIEQLKGRKIGEVGKLAIHKEYRRGGIVLKDLIPAFIHYCKEDHKFDTGFGSCVLPLERYYRKFGFERAPGAIPFIYEGLPEAVIVKFDK